MIASLFDVVVIGSIVLSAAFAAAWALRPDFREWIERPKHVFDARVREYDRRRLQ